MGEITPHLTKLELAHINIIHAIRQMCETTHTHALKWVDIQSRIALQRGPKHRPTWPLNLSCHSTRKNEQFSPVSRRWPVKVDHRAVLHFPSSLHHHCLPHIASLKSSESTALNLKSRCPFFKCIVFQTFSFLQESLGQQSIRGGVIEGAVRG